MTLKIRKSELEITLLGESVENLQSDKTLAHSAGKSGDILAQGLEFDSREVSAGNVFVALPGENSHGHQFVAKALQDGAALCVVEDAAACVRDFPGGGEIAADRLVEVSHSLAAFRTLASWWRHKVNPQTVAITGSVGKTTVKEIAAQILAAVAGQGTASKKSYNNATGVPYTLCQLSEGDKWAVLEVGMNAPGEIADLSKLIAPDLAVITKVAPAHAGFFKSVKEIADAKCEILDALPQGAPLIINADDHELQAGVERHPKGSGLKVLSFGKSPRATLRVYGIKLKRFNGAEFSLAYGGKEYSASSPLLGEHNVMNAAAALLIAVTIAPEHDLKKYVEALKNVSPPPMRMNIRKLSGDRVLIDDCYNSNPTSLRAMLDFVKAARLEGDRVGLILGDMLELGDKSEAYHRELGQEVAELAPAFLISVGKDARYFSEEAAKVGVVSHHVDCANEVAPILNTLQFDILGIKGSRGIALDSVVKQLLTA